MKREGNPGYGGWRAARAGLLALGWLYLGGLALWLVLRGLAGDQWWPVAILTIFSPFGFGPLPLVAVLALVGWRSGARGWRWALPVGVLLACAAAVMLFGGLFFSPTRSSNPASTQVRVLTYNVEGRTTDAAAVLATIQAADADLVGLQELNPQLATDLAPLVAALYPYQLLYPEWGTSGMGMYSRYPLSEQAVDFGGWWVGYPQVVRVDVDGVDLVWMNAHLMVTNPPPMSLPDYVEAVTYTHRLREENAREIAGWLAGQSGPVVFTADLNATDLSEAYETLVEAGFADTWREVGRGWGMTFPAYRQGLRPERLVRIDYVLHHGMWALDVARLPWDGVSDHRAVVATLSLGVVSRDPF